MGNTSPGACLLDHREELAAAAHRRHERPRRTVVEDGSALSDLSPVVRRLERRRGRGPPRDHRPSRPPRVVGYRRDLAEPDHRVTQRRLGLRRGRLSAPCSPTSERWRTSTVSSTEAKARGIRVLVDLVPNHTSEQHPWFVDSALLESGRPCRDWYVWADPTHRRLASQQLGAAASAARPGRSTRPPVSTTSTTTCPSSRTSTGGTTRSAERSTRSSRSGSTGAWPGSGSTCAT